MLRDEAGTPIELALPAHWGTPEILEALTVGEIEPLGLMPNSSNVTLLSRITTARGICHAIYKPGRGESPLWDYPPRLYRREMAAYALSAALGWDLIPPTVVRDGPLGEGSVQLAIDTDFTDHFFSLRDDPTHTSWLQHLALFDLVLNSGDRKGSHVIADRGGRLWAIDNALCLHEEPKLRTVIWDFAEEPIPAELLEQCTPTEAMIDAVAPWITSGEIDALRTRVEEIRRDARFPVLTQRWQVPYPPI